MTSTDLLKRLDAGQHSDADGEFDSDWTPQKLGKLVKGLGVLLKPPRRIGSNKARQYVIDGGVVRSTCRRYGLTE